MNYPPDGIQVTVNDTKLMVYRCGDIYRQLKNGDWRFIENTDNTNDGYNRIHCGSKIFRRHRIIAYAYINLDITNTKTQIDHIDHNRLNNHVDNLRIVSNKENQHNQTNPKGYYWNKHAKRWVAHIRVDNKKIHLGLFDTEEEARKAYLDAKKIYHPTAPINFTDEESLDIPYHPSSQGEVSLQAPHL